MRWIRARSDTAFVAAVFIAALAVAFAVAGPEDEEDVVQRERGMAVAKCEAFIKGSLKAPSTARFNLGALGRGPTYSVTGTVDAENSFGATLRKTVRCNVVVGSNGKSVTVTEYSGLR